VPSGAIDIVVSLGLVLACAAVLAYLVDRVYERFDWKNIYVRAAITAIVAGVGGVVSAYTILGAVQ